MILVTGATGTVGGEVARRLPAGAPVRLLARDPQRLDTAARDAEIVRGDYRDPASLRRALHGVRRVFLVTGDPSRADTALLAAARSCGVRHVVKLSAAAVLDRRADDAITRWQRHNEELLRACGIGWTLLRPRAYMSNTRAWASSIRAEGVVRALYGASPNACVDPGDVAEVAVRALTQDGHQGRAYLLTGPQPITAIEQTAQLAELLGRTLRFEELRPAQARAQLRARYPADVAEALLQSAGRRRDGAKTRVSGTVRELTGNAPRQFRAWAKDHLGEFTPP